MGTRLVGLMPMRGPSRGPKGLRRPTRISSALIISGLTKDSSGAALGGCVVKLYLTANDQIFASTTSDAGGNYYFAVPSDVSTYYLMAYKVGSPDVVGVTVNTIVGV